MLYVFHESLIVSLAFQAGGYPDLEFMLRVNQLMIDFVKDSSRTEYVHTCA